MRWLRNVWKLITGGPFGRSRYVPDEHARQAGGVE